MKLDLLMYVVNATGVEHLIKNLDFLDNRRGGLRDCFSSHANPFLQARRIMSLILVYDAPDGPLAVILKHFGAFYDDAPGKDCIVFRCRSINL